MRNNEITGRQIQRKLIKSEEKQKQLKDAESKMTRANVQKIGASLVAQIVKNLPAMPETQV